MKKFINWLRTPESILRAALYIMLIYTIHNSYILHRLEVIDFSFDLPYQSVVYHINFFNVFFALSAALATEFIVLVLFVNGKRDFAKVYAVATFCLNTFYYIYFKDNIDAAMVTVAVFVSTIHLAAIWQLGELFYELKFESKPIVNQSPSIEKCDVLDNDLNLESNIKQYKVSKLQKVDSDSKAISCPICLRVFATNYTMNRHVERRHSNQTINAYGNGQ